MNSPPFVGIDPAGLVGLADTVDQYSQRVSLAGDNLSPVLDCHSVPDERPIACSLRLVATDLADSAIGLRWRAQVIAAAELVGGFAFLSVGAWVAAFAATAAFAHTDWGEAVAVWQNAALVNRLSKLSPQDVARALAAVGPSVARELARQHPELIGPMDGVPPQLRYLANDLLIEREIERLGAIAAKADGTDSAMLSAKQLGWRANQRIAEYQRWLDEDRQILLFDPVGDGRVAEVFGGLGTARRVAVVVPGMANDISNFSANQGGFRSDARTIYDTATADDVATIAWLGYDTPDGIGAAARDSALVAAPELTRFLLGIDPEATKSITVVAHSYGSVVAGIAAAEGIAVNDLVFVGSPGTTLDTAAEAKLRRDGRVWAALAAGDPIGVGVDPLDSLRWWHGLHPLLPLLAMCRTLATRDDLWHGTNPVADSFGADRISTTGSLGHTEYFKAVALNNLVAILEGRYSDVELAGT